MPTKDYTNFTWETPNNIKANPNNINKVKNLNLELSQKKKKKKKNQPAGTQYSSPLEVEFVKSFSICYILLLFTCITNKQTKSFNTNYIIHAIYPIYIYISWVTLVIKRTKK